jgi:hypothetical protein
VQDARFFTISDERFFVGTVLLLNSLRLTGHDHELVVLDRGLTSAQRGRLAEHRVTFEHEADRGTHPWLLKPVAASLDPRGIVVLVDSDMVVTSSLQPVLSSAAGGRICVFPDHPSDLARWFPQWGEVFDLASPLRRKTYSNAGFLAFSADRWPGFLGRWRDACERIPVRDSRPDDAEPFGQLDQDALNAILMSEIPDEAVDQLPAYEWNMRNVVLADARTLACVADGRRQPLLHTPAMPKLWQAGGWRRIEKGAYVELVPRLLFAADVPIALAPSEVPFWLRPRGRSRVVVRTLRTYNRTPWVVRKIRRIPHRALRELRALARRVSGALRR